MLARIKIKVGNSNTECMQQHIDISLHLKTVIQLSPNLKMASNSTSDALILTHCCVECISCIHTLAVLRGVTKAAVTEP